MQHTIVLQVMEWNEIYAAERSLNCPFPQQLQEFVKTLEYLFSFKINVTADVNHLSSSHGIGCKLGGHIGQTETEFDNIETLH